MKYRHLLIWKEEEVTTGNGEQVFCIFVSLHLCLSVLQASSPIPVGRGLKADTLHTRLLEAVDRKLGKATD